MLAAPALVIALAVSAGTSNKWVALVHTNGDVPASWQKELQQAAEQNKLGPAWAAPPAVTLDEAQLALGCAGWSKTCAGQIAAMTGAGIALVVDVTAKDAGVVIITQPVKTTGAPAGSEERLELPARTDKDLEIAKDFVKGGKAGRGGYLIVDVDVPGADLVVDGDASKKTKLPYKEVLPPGEHKLVITAEGKAPLQKTVTLKAGAVTQESLSLSAAGPPVETTTTVGVKDHELTTTAPQPSTPAPATGDTGVVGWSLAGVGGAVTAVSSVFATAAIYDRFFNRTECGPERKACLPLVPLMLGIYDGKAGRAQFVSDSSAWIGGSVAAVGVGALLVGTGVVLASGEPPAPASTTDPAATTTTTDAAAPSR